MRLLVLLIKILLFLLLMMIRVLMRLLPLLAGCGAVGSVHKEGKGQTTGSFKL